MSTVVANPFGLRHFWAALFILTAIAIYPFWHFQYPALVDYPNHLARVNILAGLAHESINNHYEIRYELVPNLALDLFVPLTIKLGLGVEASLRLFAAIAVVTPILGTVALAFQVQKGIPWITLFAIPLALSRYYVWGFINYFFSLGVALLLIAYWLKITKKMSANSTEIVPKGLLPQSAHLFFFSVGIFGLLCSHLAGFALFLAAIYLFEGFKMLKTAQHVPQRNWSSLTKLAAVTLPSLIAYVFFFRHSDTGLQVLYFDFILGKLYGLASAFFSYRLTPAIINLVVVATAFLIVRYVFRTRIAVLPEFLPPIIGLLLVFMLAPGAMMNSYYLDRRLFVFICFVALAALKIEYTRPTVAILLITALAAVGVKTAEIWTVWGAANRDLANIRKELLAIPPGAKLVQHQIMPAGLKYDSEVIRHAAAFAVIDRGAFIPTLFAQPFNGESVAYLDLRGGGLNASDGDTLTSPKDVNVRWPKICVSYQYALLTGVVQGVDYPNCVKTMASGPNFVLLFVTKNNAQ